MRRWLAGAAVALLSMAGAGAASAQEAVSVRTYHGGLYGYSGHSYRYYGGAPYNPSYYHAPYRTFVRYEYRVYQRPYYFRWYWYWPYYANNPNVTPNTYWYWGW